MPHTIIFRRRTEKILFFSRRKPHEIIQQPKLTFLCTALSTTIAVALGNQIGYYIGKQECSRLKIFVHVGISIVKVTVLK
jgi:hypothetical protein